MALFTLRDRISSKVIHEGLINLRVDMLKNESGKSVSRDVVEHNGGVVIAASPEPGSILLVRQYRYCVDSYLVELPAGRLEAGEEPFPAAQRELREETGYVAGDWREISRFFTAPGFCDELLYMYSASGLSFVGKDLDEDEETEVIAVSLVEAWEMVMDGRINDAKTMVGLAYLNFSPVGSN